MISIPTERDSFHEFIGHLFRWTVRASLAYVAAVAAAVWAWRLEAAFVTAALIGVLAGAAGLYLRVRLLVLTATRGNAAFAALSVLGQLAVLGCGLAVAMAATPAGFLAAAGGVVLGNVMIIVVGLRTSTSSRQA